MSLPRQSSKRPARVSSRSAKKMKLSSPKAAKTERKVDIIYDVASSPEAVQPDSGFCENLDNELDFSVDKSLPSYGNSNEDWILYADEGISEDGGYVFQEEDGLDIASVKANPGSCFNGKNNESFLPSLSFEDGRFHLKDVYDSPRHPEHPTHVFTEHPTTRDATVSTLQRWVRTFEQHEELAYCFEQSPQTVNCPYESQQIRVWNETVDLSIYDIRD